MTGRRIASTVAAFALVAAGPALAADLAKAIQGKWKADMAATLKESPMYQKMPPAAQKQMLEEMDKAPAFLFEFTDKTIVSKSGDDPPETATYTVLKNEGKVLALQVVSKTKEGTDVREDTDVELAGADSIRLSKKGGDAVLVLRRVK